MTKTSIDKRVEDGTFLAENFSVAPQNAAALVAGDGQPKAEIENKLRRRQRSPDDATGDLIPDDDETRLKPVLKGANKRSGGG